MQRVYQFHHFGKGAKRIGAPWERQRCVSPAARAFASRSVGPILVESGESRSVSCPRGRSTHRSRWPRTRAKRTNARLSRGTSVPATTITFRSEERRVGKECRSRWAAEPEKKK